MKILTSIEQPYLVLPEEAGEYGRSVSRDVYRVDQQLLASAGSAYERVLADPKGFGDFLKSRMRTPLIHNQWSTTVAFGAHLEDQMHHQLMQETDLKRLLKRHPRLPGSGGVPDWGHIRRADVYWDLTTPMMVESHQARDVYGALLRMVVYPRSLRFGDLLADALEHCGQTIGEEQRQRLISGNDNTVREQAALVAAQRSGNHPEMSRLNEIRRLERESYRTRRATLLSRHSPMGASEERLAGLKAKGAIPLSEGGVLPVSPSQGVHSL